MRKTIPLILALVMTLGTVFAVSPADALALERTGNNPRLAALKNRAQQKINKTDRSYAFSVSPRSVTIRPRKKKQLIVRAKKRSSYTWTTSNPSVVRVTKKGKLRSIAPGTAVITASEPHGNVCRIKVTVRPYRWSLVSYPDSSGDQGMFYTLKNRDTGKLIVVDGGSEQNTYRVRSTIESLGGKVDCWFITHYHRDHVGAFNVIYKNPGGIKIKKVCASPLSVKGFKKTEKPWDDPECFYRFRKITKKRKNVHYPKRGDVLFVDDLRIEIFNSYDKTVSHLKSDLANNCSLIFKISGKRDSILFFGDAYNTSLFNYIYRRFGTRMRAKYIQAAHHGNSTLPKKKYKLLKPKYMLLDGPSWLMTSSTHRAKNLLAWCRKNKIKTYDHRTAPNKFSFK